MKALARYVLLTAAAVLALNPAPVRAQQDVMRDAFGFFGSSLDVLIEADAPGRIRLVRGQRSRIEVAGRAPDGLTAAALGGHGVRRLTLTAFGEGRVDFLVSVPEDVRVRIYRPGVDHSELFGPLSETATYAWEPVEPRPSIETVGPAARVGAVVPRSLDIRGAHRLDRLTLRVGARAFAVSPRTARTSERVAGEMVVDATDGGDIAIDVPDDARFSLQLDGTDAIIIDRGDVRILCESVLSQTLPDGTRWLTLTPDAARGCSEPPVRLAPPARTDAARRT